MVTATPDVRNMHTSPSAAVVRRAGDFPSADFALIRDVPVFAEHETKGRDGRILKFGPPELAALVEKCNKRISETNDYAAITLGHTPEPGEGEQPEVIGMAGPFRLGTLGAENPKTVVLADFHIFQDRVDELRKYPRRSPELWLEEDYADMFLDPIALLGAEAPRLDMGLLYSAERNGQLVEKYTAVAPSAANAFVRTDDLDRKKTYSAGDGDMYGAAGNGELSPDALTQIVEVLDNLDWVKDMKAFIAAQGGNNATPAPAAIPAAVDDPMQQQPVGEPPVPPAGELLPNDQPDIADGGDVDAPEATMPEDDRTKILDDMPDDEPVIDDDDGDNVSVNIDTDGDDEEEGKKKKYEGDDEMKDDDKDKMEKYSRSLGTAQGEIATLTAEVAQLKVELNTERGHRIDAERTQQLGDDRQRYAFDLEKEVERCRFSRKGGMTDEQFAEHRTFIADNCRGIPVGEQYLPTHNAGAVDPNAGGGNGTGGALKEQYSKDRSDKAFQIVQQRRLDGKPVSDNEYEAVLQELADGKTVTE